MVKCILNQFCSDIQFNITGIVRLVYSLMISSCSRKGLRSQDNLSLNKYVLPTYRQENSFVKYITLENHSNSNSNSNSTNSLQQQQHRHQTYQRNQKQSLLLQNSDLNTSKSQVLNTTTTNSTDSNHNPLLTRSIHYEIDQNDKSKSINITTTTTAGTTSSITTTNSSVDNLSDHLISSTKHLSKLVPPLIGLNEINVNDSQTLQHDLCISSSNNDNDNDDDHDDDDDGDDLSNPCHSQRDQSINNNNNNDLLINNHHHNHWQDSIQSTCWLPKVAMNSNRTKCDEILSTNWNLLTMKNWKSDQELKRKMGLLNPHHHNKLGGGGGFWFREKAFNHTKSFIPGRRRIEQQQQQQQQSKGMSFSAIVNHCPLINQYLSSNKALHCQFDTGPMEQTEIFSLPEAKSKFSLDNSLLSSNRISSIHNINTTNNTTNTTITTTTNNNNKKVKNTKSLIQSNNDSMDDFNKTIKCKFNQLQSDTNDTPLSSLLSIQNTQHFITKYPDTKLYLNEKAPATTTTTLMNGSNVIQQSKDNLSLKINQPNEYTPSLSSSRRYQHSQQCTHHSDYDNGIQLKDISNRELIIPLHTTTNNTTNTTTTTTTNNNNNNNNNNGNQLCTDDVIRDKFKEKSILIESQKLNNNQQQNDNELIKFNGKINIPMTPHTALNLYGKKLTSYEKEEILNFNKIWYLGLSAQKIDAIQGSPSNHGYDDETGGYLKITHDHIAYRFQTLETLGKGSFGRVIRAIDHKSGFPVAIKIIRNKKRFHQQAQVEVDILENLKKADYKNIHNIIHIRDHFTFRNHLCIVFDLLGSNLYDLLRKNDFRGFTIHSLKKITIKLLNCLCLLRKQGIIHCDLKPENILIGLNNPSELKVIDFGSSCFVNQKTYTYIQSRFYRAPEIILGISYGPPIDMWSLGCILPELYTGRPLFPGENENEQLACIMEVLGLPSELQLEKASRRRVFFDSKRTPRYLTNSRGRKRIPGTETIENLVKTVDLKFINLLNQCLTVDSMDYNE
ncbi:unnamed protein product [Schistosoma intercalatum]|nr:unnamed protein product [Schistosoma intercalatum]